MPSNATSVIWTIPAAGTIINGQGTSSITVSYPSTTVGGQVTAQSVNNCSVSSIRTLNVKLSGCPSNFAPDSTSTGRMPIEYSKGADVQISPNPTQSSFKLLLNGFSVTGENVKIKLMDVQGRVISCTNMMPAESLSFGNDLKAGTYFLQIVQGRKIIIRRLIKY
jgi:hypothetical protein